MKYFHWSQAGAEWPLHHFTPKELACKCCGVLILDFKAAKNLDYTRMRYNGPLVINSGYRCPKHNEAVGGAPRSFHLQGRAFDIACKNDQMPRLIQIAFTQGFDGFGVYDNFLHVDTGAPRMWAQQK